jgi:DNA-directed RNA polymerase subunit RPC12/RpoP
MARTTHVCAGCHAELSGKDDLDKEVGDVYSKWNCRYCGTRVPGVVAEKLKHQR